MMNANILISNVSENKLKLANTFGLTHGINASEIKNVSAQALEVVGSKGADIVIDTTGNTRVIEEAYNLTHASGKTILVDVHKIGDNINIYSLPLHFSKTLVGSHGGNAIPDKDIPRYLKLLTNSKLKFDGLITNEYPLCEINTAIQKMRSGHLAGRIMINMSS